MQLHHLEALIRPWRRYPSWMSSCDEQRLGGMGQGGAVLSLQLILRYGRLSLIL